MIYLKSAAKHTYKNKVVLPNDIFTVDSEQDAEDLCALHFATRIDREQPTPVEEPSDAPTDAPVAEPAPGESITAKRTPRRAYNRRDMTVEK